MAAIKISVASFVVLLLSLSAVESHAATINAANASYAAVAAAVAAASSGDTVQVPVGSATWSNTLSISKGLILRGAGVGSTVITSGLISTGASLISYRPANPSLNEPFELSGFTFDGQFKSAILNLSSNSSTLAITKLRVHDNLFKNGNRQAIAMGGLEFGVFYNNTFDSDYIDISVIGSEVDGWNYPLMVGGPNYPYFEDNTFLETTVRGAFVVETGRGGRIVFRFNTITNRGGEGDETFDAHGVNSQYPIDNGTVAFEYYNNTISLRSPIRVLFHRGGRGLVFNNTQTGASGYVNLTEYQGWSYCTSAGYPKPEQLSNSFYFANSSQLSPRLYCPTDGCNSSCNQWDSTYIQLNRDYFTPTSGLDGAKPSTCADNTYYGATDTRKIYKCHPANVWTTYYTAYAYPHPMRNGVMPLATPTNLRIVR